MALVERQTLNNTRDEDDYRYTFARLAVDKAKLCPDDSAASNPTPRVGIVIARRGVLLGWAAKGHSGEYLRDGEMHPFCVTNPDHAEQALLAHLASTDLTGAEAYVTLEPCTKRRQRTSCAELLVQVGISNIYVGNCDPNPNIGALAWERFFKAGMVVRDFPGDLRNEARRDNAAS